MTKKRDRERDNKKQNILWRIVGEVTWLQRETEREEEREREGGRNRVREKEGKLVGRNKRNVTKNKNIIDFRLCSILFFLVCNFSSKVCRGLCGSEKERRKNRTHKISLCEKAADKQTRSTQFQ